VQRLPYRGIDISSLVDEVGMPRSAANSLANALSAKLTSPKAAVADFGYRPVR
jgi:hypothetical protein